MFHNGKDRKRILATPDPEQTPGSRAQSTRRRMETANAHTGTTRTLSNIQPTDQQSQQTTNVAIRAVSIVSISSTETVHNNSQSGWIMGSQAYLSFDPAPAVRSIIRDTCLRIFSHEGESLFLCQFSSFDVDSMYCILDQSY